MSLVFFTCVFTCLGIAVSVLRRGADFFSPARVFAFVWSFAIGLSELKLSRLQHEWAMESWVVLLLGPASFLCGTYVVYVLNLGSRLLPLEEIRANWDSIEIDHRKLYASIAILFILFVAGYLMLVLAGREIPLLSHRPGQARKAFQMFGVGLLTNNVVMIVYLTVLYLTGKAKNLMKRTPLLVVSLISFLMYVTTLGRLNLFIAIILSCVLVYYTSRKIRLSTALMVLALIALIVSISSLRSGGLVFSEFLFLASQMRISPYLAFITEPYMYTVMNLEMFVRSVERIDQFTYGFYTFDFVTALTGLKHWMAEYFNLNETPYLYSGYNTYTAFWTYYRDFGILGVFLIGFIGGSGISTIYYSLRKRPGYLSVTAYSIAVYLMILSLVNSQIGFLWIVYEVTILCMIVFLVSRPVAVDSYGRKF